MSGFSTPSRCYGQTHISNGGSTVIVSADEWTPIDGATYSHGLCRFFTQTNATSEMRYNGVTPRRFIVRAVLSVTSDKADNFSFAFAKNGVAIESSTIDKHIVAGTDQTSVAIAWAVCLNNNDIISMVAKSSVQTNVSLTNDHATMIVATI